MLGSASGKQVLDAQAIIEQGNDKKASKDIRRQAKKLKKGGLKKIENDLRKVCKKINK